MQFQSGHRTAGSVTEYGELLPIMGRRLLKGENVDSSRQRNPPAIGRTNHHNR
jgi:hypothetical protein